MRLAASLAVVLLVAKAPGAIASEGVAPAVFAAKMFGKTPGAGKTNVCFKRVYDAAHLAAHPAQKVTAMTVEVTVQAGPDHSGPQYSFGIGVSERGSAKLYSSGGGCNLSNSSGLDNGLRDQMSCSVDCDNGGIDLLLPVDDTGIVAQFDKGGRISLPYKGNLEKAIVLVPGTDDRSFRLDRVDMRECRALIDALVDQ